MVPLRESSWALTKEGANASEAAAAAVRMASIVVVEEECVVDGPACLLAGARGSRALENEAQQSITISFSKGEAG